MILTLVGALAAMPIDQVAEEIDQVEVARDELGRMVDLRGGFDTAEREEQLFEAAATAFVLEDWSEAAMGFRVFLHLGSRDPTLVHAAEYLLPRCFEGMGFLEQAAAGYEQLAHGTHPLRDDALGSLVRLRSEMGPPEAFAAVFEEASRTARLRPTPALTYVLGRAHYELGQLTEAEAVLRSVPIDSTHGLRAAYLRGVLQLRGGEVDGARARFEGLAGLEPELPVEQHVRDLARLAVARIDMDRGDYERASEGYAALAGQDSVLDQSVVESLWNQVVLEDWSSALLAFGYLQHSHPDHREAGRMRVLEGHVLFRMGRDVEAEASWERVVGLFDSIVERLELLDLDDADTVELIQDPTGWRPHRGLPPVWALRELGQAPGFQEVLDLRGDALWIEAERAEAEAMVAEVADALSSGGAIGRFQLYRQEADDQLGSLVKLRLRVGLDEAETLYRAGVISRKRARELSAPLMEELGRQVEAGAVRAERFVRIAELRADRRELRTQQRLQRLEATEALIGALEAELRALEEERRRPLFDALQLAAVASLAEPLREARVPEVGMEAHDALVERVDAEIARTAMLRERIDADERAARRSIQATLEAETRSLRAMEDEVVQTAGRVEQIWTDSATNARRFVADRLLDARVQAEAGLGDVAWQRLLETRERIGAVQDEQRTALAELEQRLLMLRTRGEYDLRPDPGSARPGYDVLKSR